MDAPAKEKNAVPVDLLGRQEIVDRIMKILEVISENKTSCTFALNGPWGTGKTFVLNMLMNQLWEYHSDKYIVFHYNCWQYDYYEEPLIAIVAAMLDSVDEENHLLPANLRDKAKAGMELAKPILKKIAMDFVKNKIGVDLTDVVSVVNDYQDVLDNEAQKKAEDRSFDEFYSFKKAIQQAQDEIRKLTKDRTLVVVVDELDRCLPSYAIKVLERLHHLFADVSNSAVLLAVDQKQLSQTIRSIFGADTTVDNYLKKFIDFTIPLHIGNMVYSNMFLEKYHDYVELFDNSIIQTTFPFEVFFNNIFHGIDVRTQEKLISRVKMVHKIIFREKKADYSIMCFELLMIVLLDYYQCNHITMHSAEGNLFLDIPGPARDIGQINHIIRQYWTDEYVGFQYSLDNKQKVPTISGDCAIQKLLYYYINGLQTPYPYCNTDIAGCPDNLSDPHPASGSFARFVKNNLALLHAEFKLLREIR